jgi:predicted N-acyltransferase
VALSLRTHESIRDVGEATWRELSRGLPPFLSFEWLDALERTGCVRPERGWLPLHLTLRDEADEVLAAAPAYLKGNSEGEFVFDHGWAGFAERRLGIDYYPKLIVAVPFTPANGPRLLTRPGVALDDLAGAFAVALHTLAKKLEASGAHVLFPTAEEADALEDAGLARRAGIQFHWRNRGYESFDDFLAGFDSKRRHQIRRERREVASQGLELESVLGSELTPSLVDTVFELYLSTVEKHYWGRQYLNRDFFHQVASTMGDRIHVVLARERGKRRPIAGAFNLLGEHALYGRYWGCLEERPFLHFSVCYYQGIDECIRRKLDVFEPGAGGEHKVARGFLPTVTHSVHALVDRRLDRAVREFVREEREAVALHVGHAKSPFRVIGE